MPDALLPLVKVAMPPAAELMPALEAVLYSGQIAEGEAVYQFEAAFSAHFGLRNALAFSSGTGALHAALLLAGAGPGQEVITTSMTAEPTNIAILHTGAAPVFADVDPRSGNLAPAAVEAAITPRTRAILVVHYAGFPAAMGALREIADRHGLYLIEDCAHALGSRYEDQPIGSMGDAAIYSFQAIKHMTTVDGGMLALRDATQIDAAREIRWFGLRKGVPRTSIDVKRVGYKYNMNNVTATIGSVQLRHIDSLLARHVDNGRYFDENIGSISGLSVTLFEAAANPSYWLYTVLSDDSDDIERRLAAAGIAASKLHRPNHLHTLFGQQELALPGLYTFYRRMVHIPCGWWVSDEHRDAIVTALAKG